MTDGSAWRWRWLLDARLTLARLSASLASAAEGDARLVRAMIADLRRTRRQVRALATTEADAAALAGVPGVGDSALAVALRLGGASVGAAAASGGTTPGRLAEALRRLAAAVGGEEEARPAEERGQAPARLDPARPATPRAPRAAGEERDRGVPDPEHSLPHGEVGGPETWLGRARDTARTLRRITLAVRAGRLGADTAAAPLCLGAPRGGGGYILIRFAAPVAAVWAELRRTGLRLLGPAAAT